MARRPRHWYIYRSDHNGTGAGTEDFISLIPDDEAADASRGWEVPTANLDMMPRRLKARHVDGVDADGNHARAVCATASCDLWTGAATTFEVDGVTYEVIGYSGERRTIRRFA